MDAKKLALLCRTLAENKKAENIVVLDVRKLSSVTDFFVIASGGSEPHLRAIVNEITGRLWDDFQVRPRRVEGGPAAAWQVLDFFDVIVHVMRDEVRAKYDLESLWGDAPRAGVRRAKKRPGGTAGKVRRGQP
jgi:ribosome-associated protein